MTHTSPPAAGLQLRYGLVYAALFLQFGFMLPFWPVYLKAHGLDAQAIGLFYAVMGMARIVTTPLIAVIGERFSQSPRFLLSLALGAAITYAAFSTTRDIYVLLLLAIAIAGFFHSVMPILDAKVLADAHARGFSYGRVRLWGSASFIAMNIVGGALVGLWGASSINWMLVAAALIGAASTFLLPPVVRGESERRAPAFGQILVLMSDRHLMAFLIAAGIGQAAHSVYYTFGTLQWQRLGYDDTLIGILWATGVIAEIVLFAFGQGLTKRFSPVSLVAIAVSFAALRWLAMACDPSLPILFLLQGLHAFSFAALHLGAMGGLYRMVPPAMAATAQSLYAALSGGVLMSVASAMAGPLYGAFGGHAYFFAAGLSVLALAMVLALRRWPLPSRVSTP